jgi:formyl-CoA transferase
LTCQVIGKPEWADDPAYATARARQPQIFDIFAEIEKCLADKTKFEAVDILRKFGVPRAPVLSKKEIANEPCAPVAQWLRCSRRSAATT